MDFEKLAHEEMKDLRDQITQCESELVQMVIPADRDDENNAVLEVRAGTGGREAAIFAAQVNKWLLKLRIWYINVFHE